MSSGSAGHRQSSPGDRCIPSVLVADPTGRTYAVAQSAAPPRRHGAQVGIRSPVLKRSGSLLVGTGQELRSARPAAIRAHASQSSDGPRKACR
jgi:hypothetical protein